LFRSGFTAAGWIIAPCLDRAQLLVGILFAPNHKGMSGQHVTSTEHHIESGVILLASEVLRDDQGVVARSGVPAYDEDCERAGNCGYNVEPHGVGEPVSAGSDSDRSIHSVSPITNS